MRDKLTKFLLWALRKVTRNQVIQEDLDDYGINIQLDGKTADLSIISPGKKEEVSKFLNEF
jgi:hypothetical protein